MALKALILVLATSAVALCQDGPIPEVNYVIRSAMDGGIIRPSGSGALCENLSRVVPIYRLNAPYPENYWWFFRNTSTPGELWIDSAMREPGFIINDVAFDENYPPFCYLMQRYLQVSPHPNGGFQVFDRMNQKCMSSLGSEVGIIFWSNCGQVGQNWEFIPV